jgi:predicted regulator of Ras-like GTPase activity (Roadblock/LC7/MglB family)
MTPRGTDSNELSWLLDDLVSRVEGTHHTILLSTDGLLMASSSRLDRPAAEHLAAITSGVQSLAVGVGKQFSAGDIRQTIIEMDEAFLVIANAGEGACLALLASASCDLGMVAYEMQSVVQRVGQYLAAPPRPDMPTTPATHLER